MAASVHLTRLSLGGLGCAMSTPFHKRDLDEARRPTTSFSRAAEGGAVCKQS